MDQEEFIIMNKKILKQQQPQDSCSTIRNLNKTIVNIKKKKKNIENDEPSLLPKNQSLITPPRVAGGSTTIEQQEQQNDGMKHPIQSPLNDSLTQLKIQSLEKEIKLQNELIDQTEEDMSMRVTYWHTMLESVCKDIINIANNQQQYNDDDAEEEQQFESEQLMLEGDSLLEEESFLPPQSEISPIKKAEGHVVELNGSPILDIDFGFGEGGDNMTGESPATTLQQSIIVEEEPADEKCSILNTSSTTINESNIDNQLKDLNRKLRDVEGQLAMNSHNSKLDISNLEKDLGQKIEVIDKKIDFLDTKEDTVLSSIKRLSMDLSAKSNCTTEEPSSKITEIVHHNHLDFKVVMAILVIIAAIYFGITLIKDDSPPTF